MKGNASFVCRAVGFACLIAGCALAAGRSFWGEWVFWLLVGFALLFRWRPRWGLLALPALLPALDFAPWTGALMTDEFDLLVLTVLSVGYFWMAGKGRAGRPARIAAGLAIVIFGLIVRSAGGLPWLDWNAFAGYGSPANAWRVGKSLLWTALLWPLFAAAARAAPGGRADFLARFFWAALAGSVWVVLAVAWERAFFPGLLDFRTPYRTVGPFWEMHQGGAALDLYLTLTAPLIAWAWRRPLPPGGRALLGVFALAFAYAVLTAFSRGLAAAAAGALLLQAWLYARRARERNEAAPTPGEAGARRSGPGRTRPASVLLIALIVAEAFIIFGADSFMNRRLRGAGDDFGGRLAHWQRALGALETPGDWLIGIGLGKFPAPGLQRRLGVPLPGVFEAANPAGATPGARLAGPDRLPQKFLRKSVLFAVGQRIESAPGAPYKLTVRARVVPKEEGPQAHAASSLRLNAFVCGAHLLTPVNCGSANLRFSGGEWSEQSAAIARRTPPGVPPRLAAGHTVFLLSVPTPGAALELAEARLEADGAPLELA
ncbi:MAG: hypothetical protein LBS70_03285, partial [Candidatus Accumulibacter sp.]|nr:hypothetical protein [Accumulibacter sp.]